jgi:peroxiredoxin
MAAPKSFKILAGSIIALFILIVAAAAGVAFKVGMADGQEIRSAEESALSAGNLRLGDKMPDFEVTARDGKSFHLKDAIDGKHFVVVTFHHPDCPCSENCGKLISEMEGAGYDDVRVIGVMSSGTKNEMDLKNLDEQVSEGVITFPVYMDHERAVQKMLGATRTPEMWVLDKDGTIAFYGAPENTLFPGSEGHRYLLREAIDALRAGRQPEIRRYDPIGCPITG